MRGARVTVHGLYFPLFRAINTLASCEYAANQLKPGLFDRWRAFVKM
jgi:hypothetical protein